MSGTLRKPSYKYMHVILNQCVRGRMPQAMFAVFLHSTLRVFICIAGISLTASSVGGGKASPVALLFGLAVLMATFLAGELLTYGLYGILSPVVRNKAASIKDIFRGFTDKSRRVAKASALFTAMNFAAMVLMSLLLALPSSPLKKLPEELGNNATLLAATLAFMFLAAVLTLPFTFSYLILLTKADTGALQSFAVSFRLIIRQIPHFIGFVKYAGGRDLVTALIIQLLLFVMPKGENAGTSVQLLSTIASFLGVLAEYRALTRGYLAICIYFLSEAGILRPHGGQESVGGSTDVVPGGTAGEPGETDPAGDNAP